MRILSGIQPTGILHIGNYFGMMRPAIALQDEGEALYFIADYHALTSLRDPLALRENSRRVALDFIACGLNPDKAALFRQSDVRQVTELAWILSTVTPVSRLELAHSYKDKIARGAPAAAGLFTYPVLMAADILIYDSDIVPVGKDQKQHLEIARDIATRINETFGSKREGRVLKLPEARIQAQTEVVPGIDGQKMSKSYGNTIDIFGDEKEMRKRVMSIVTDSTRWRLPRIRIRRPLCNFTRWSLPKRRLKRCGSSLEKAAAATAISKNSCSKNCGIILRQCGNGVMKSCGTRITSRASSHRAPDVQTRSRTE